MELFQKTLKSALLVLLGQAIIAHSSAQVSQPSLACASEALVEVAAGGSFFGEGATVSDAALDALVYLGGGLPTCSYCSEAGNCAPYAKGGQLVTASVSIQEFVDANGVSSFEITGVTDTGSSYVEGCTRC